VKQWRVPAERLVFGAGVLGLLASLGWSWWAHGEVKRIRMQSIAVHVTQSVYSPAELTTAAVEPPTWSSPTPARAAAGWTFDLFTPPAIFYDRTTGQFTVTPAASAMKTSAAAIELIAVRRELYRLQLCGYFGEPSAYTAVFTQPGKPGALLGKGGTRFAELALALRKISVRRVPSSEGDPRVFFATDTSAELYDELAGTVVTLHDHEPTFAPAPVATVRINQPEVALREVRTGEVVSVGSSKYRVAGITCTPEELVLTREVPDTTPTETLVLHPAGIIPSTVAQRSTDSTSITSGGPPVLSPSITSPSYETYR